MDYLHIALRVIGLGVALCLLFLALLNAVAPARVPASLDLAVTFVDGLLWLIGAVAVFAAVVLGALSFAIGAGEDDHGNPTIERRQ